MISLNKSVEPQLKMTVTSGFSDAMYFSLFFYRSYRHYTSVSVPEITQQLDTTLEVIAGRFQYKSGGFV